MKFKIRIEKLDEETDSTNQIEQNEYYYPELFDLITNEMYLIPLWSGIVIFKVQQRYKDYYNQVLCRLTNNFVENWFGNLKNNILFGRLMMTSELTAKLYQRIVSKYIEFYMISKKRNSLKENILSSSNGFILSCDQNEKASNSNESST